jgi:methionyl-tRNA formyltransferase
MRVVFLGTGEFGVGALRNILQAGHAVTTVISQPDRPAGRGREIRPTPIHATADALGLRHVQTEDVNALDLAATLDHADLGVVVAFGQKIGPALLAALPRGCINIHGSLLPKYRGAAPFQRAVIAGETTTGVTVFQLNERWDAGAIWGQRSTAIGPTQTADELHDQLAQLGAELIVDVLRDIESGRAQPVQQDPAQATRAPKLAKAEGTVDWSQPATRVASRINGLWSWPAAACLLVTQAGKQERVLLARAAVADDTTPPTPDLLPGHITDDGTVQTGAGRVRLLELRPASGKLMSFAAFANGRRLARGDRFVPVEP